MALRAGPGMNIRHLQDTPIPRILPLHVLLALQISYVTIEIDKII